MKYPLHACVLKSDIKGTKKFINKGKNLNELDNQGYSPLHWAVLRGDTDIVKVLLESGANPNVISSDGYTPKWTADDFGLLEVIDILNSFNGKIITNENFDRTSWTIFKGALGEPLPKEEL